MTNIHPTAVIGPEVELAEEVSIGPFSVLEGQIKIGRGTKLLERVSIRGKVTIGEDNVIYPNAIIGFTPQDMGYFNEVDKGFGVIIGNNNCIREGSTIHNASREESPTTVGNNNFLMAYSHMAHDARVDNNVILVNGCLVAGHAHVMDNAILAGNAAIHQFSKIGRFSMLAGNQGLVKDLPPFIMSYSDRTVGSLNLVGLRRAGLRDHIKPLKEAFNMLYKTGMRHKEAAAEIKVAFPDDALCQELADFVIDSKRGITEFYKDFRHGYDA